MSIQYAIAEQDNPRIYVACLAAYNNGKLHGRWIDANQDADEIFEHIKAMLAESPEPDAEEFAIHDYEYFHGLNIHEYTGIRELALLAELIGRHGEPFALWVDYHGIAGELTEESEEEFQDAYIGEYDDQADFAQENAYHDEIPDALERYIDWDSWGRDLLIDGYTGITNSSYNIYVYIM